MATFAQAPDYHDLIRARLNRLGAWLAEEVPGCVSRGVTDSAPLLERGFARRAGLGWVGKNCMLINPRHGSFLMLGALLTDVELQADGPFEKQHCGTCTACLDACPTEAFVAPGVLDARRCVSYLTIERRGPIDEELRPGLGGWLFGCDVCQDVCPWNRKAQHDPDTPLRPRPDLMALDPRELLSLSEAEFRQRFRGTALWRAKRSGLVRNAAIVLGNVGTREDLSALRNALADADEMVREAAAWAIAAIEGASR